MAQIVADRPRVGLRRVVSVAVVALVVVAGALALKHHHDDRPYSREPYLGRVIDPGLARTERAFVRELGAGDVVAILGARTAPGSRSDMLRFLARYQGHPSTVVRMSPADDATADEVFEVACSPSDIQRFTFNWGWFDGGWRAFPEIALDRNGHQVDYRRCGS